MAGGPDPEDRPFTAAELEEFERERVFAPDEMLQPERFPRLFNLSAAFWYRAVIRPREPAPPEYVTVPLSGRYDEADLSIAVTRWNLLWEAAQLRRRFFDEDDLPEPLRSVADAGDVNVVFVPRSTSRYHEYAPLYHLLPRATLERFGLPLLTAGQWPYLAGNADHDRWLPDDFAERLGRAWAWAVWRDLIPGSALGAFSRTDPVRLLAHNLDFWVPPVTEVMQQYLGDFPVVDSDIEVGPVVLQDQSVLQDATTGAPRMGGDLWCGEADAAEVLSATVEQADSTGRLRAILDAVRTHRVEDDFSDRWSYAREDFERKLYRKRSKVQVRFVELTDTIPLQGPETEVLGSLVTADFLAMLDPVDRQVVVLLNSGVTRLTDVAREMGYANHSAVSKRLARIRQQATAFFDQCD